MDILITYATRHNSTKEIAEFITDYLSEKYKNVSVLELSMVRKLTLLM